MEQQLEKYRDQQKETWNAFSPGWKKWDDWVMTFLGPMGTEIIKDLNLKPTDNILDVATGTGEPGQAIAGIVSQGKVTGQDLSEGMLEVARENAARKGLTNYTTVACDISELPFGEGTFDGVSCRMGFMFFPDMLTAAREMYRVLKPGGRLSTAVWGAPDRNFWVSGFMKVMAGNIDMPKLPPDAPGIFRCADAAMMQKLLEQAGFRNVTARDYFGAADAESIDFYWTYMNELAAPVVSAMRKADEATRVKIKKEVYETVRNKYKADGPLKLDYHAIILTGEK